MYMFNLAIAPSLKKDLIKNKRKTLVLIVMEAASVPTVTASVAEEASSFFGFD